VLKCQRQVKASALKQ